MKTTAILGLCGLLLLSAPAAAQDTRRAPAPAEPAVTDLADLSPEDLPAVERLVADEATHRDRVARIRRLRELAADHNDTGRLAQLDELERLELQRHEERRADSRRELSPRAWQGTQDFLARGGVLRARLGDLSPERLRSQNHQVQRERAANQDHKQGRRTASQPARSPSRAPARSPARSPRPRGLR